MTAAGLPKPRATTASTGPSSKRGKLLRLRREHVTRLSRSSRVDEATEVVRAGGPAVDEDNARGRAVARRSPARGRRHRCPDRATVPVTPPSAVNEALAVRDHLGDRRGAEHTESLRIAQRLDRVARQRGTTCACGPSSGGADDDSSVGIFALGPAHDTVDRRQRVMHDLAVRRRHRLQRSGDAGRLDELGHLSERTVRGRPDASPGNRPHRIAAVSRGRPDGAGRRPGQGPGWPAACDRSVR